MSTMDDNESTRIIARPGPRTTPFGTGPQSVATPAANPAPTPAPVAPPEVRASEVRASAPVVLPADAVRPRPVMTPPDVPARPLAGPASLAARTPVPVTPPAARSPVPQAAPAVPVVPVVAQVAAPAAPPAIEPVTGWLVVMKGPGRGASLALHAGRNALGAGEDQDLRVAFGDPAIAASGHAYLVYDDESRGFFIEDGKKKDLVRVNGLMLTETRALASGDEIRIGQTTLRFVAFCGPAFDWNADDKPLALPPAVPALPQVEAEASSTDEAPEAASAPTPSDENGAGI